MDIKTVTVIGANGTMGRNVAAIFASFGNAKVYMACRDLQKAEKAKALAIKSVRADSIAPNLIPVDYSDLLRCVSESELIVEHVVEDMELKVSIFDQIAEAVKPDALVCSGTSGLSITRLAECFNDTVRRRFFGLHMFNPPYNLTLCELIPTCYSDRTLYKTFAEYLSSTLFRTVVEVKDSPAFLGNRIGFQFINEALQYAEKYKDNGGIDYIDAILGCYTGRTMPPLTTADFVGLDVHKAIVDNVYSNLKDYAHESFALPAFVQKLIDEGKLGRKTGAGFYQLVRYDGGLKRMTVYDIASGTYRDQIPYTFPFKQKIIHDLQKGSYKTAFGELIHNHSQEAEIALGFMLKYVVYSLMAAEQVGSSVHAADDVMATGFNWCPPLAVRDVLSSVADFDALVKERLSIPGVDIDHYLSLAEPSHYDYRSFFKAKS